MEKAHINYLKSLEATQKAVDALPETSNVSFLDVKQAAEVELKPEGSETATVTTQADSEAAKESPVAGTKVSPSSMEHKLTEGEAIDALRLIVNDLFYLSLKCELAANSEDDVHICTTPSENGEIWDLESPYNLGILMPYGLGYKVIAGDNLLDLYCPKFSDDVDLDTRQEKQETAAKNLRDSILKRMKEFSEDEKYLTTREVLSFFFEEKPWIRLDQNCAEFMNDHWIKLDIEELDSLVRTKLNEATRDERQSIMESLYDVRKHFTFSIPHDEMQSDDNVNENEKEELKEETPDVAQEAPSTLEATSEGISEAVSEVASSSTGQTDPAETDAVPAPSATPSTPAPIAATATPATPAAAASKSEFPSAHHRNAFYVFRSLCRLTAMVPEEDLSPSGKTGGLTDAQLAAKHHSVALISDEALLADATSLQSKLLSLDLVAGVLEQAGPAMRSSPKIVSVIRQFLCIGLLKNFVSTITPLAALSLRTFIALVRSFKAAVATETEVFISSIFVRILTSPNAHLEQKLAVVTAFRALCSSPSDILELFLNYDCRAGRKNVFEESVKALATIARDRQALAEDSMLKDGASIAATLVTGSSGPGGPNRMGPGSRSASSSLSAAAIGALMSICSSIVILADKAISQINEQQHQVLVQEILPTASDALVDAAPSPGGTSDIDGASGSAPGGALDTPATPTPASAPSSVQSSSSLLARGFEAQRRHRELMEKAAVKFAMKPKAGIEYMQSVGLCGTNPEDVAAVFLENKEILDKTGMGEYMGEDKNFNIAVLHAYAGLLNFTKMKFDEAIRLFLSGFRLPGEAQKIDRMMESFASRFCICNPGVFPNPDTAFILAYSVIMLQTDAHNPNIPKEKKMTKAMFIRNNRGIADGGDLPDEFLSEIYDAICERPFTLREDEMLRTKTTESLGEKARKAALEEERAAILEASTAAISHQHTGQQRYAILPKGSGAGAGAAAGSDGGVAAGASDALGSGRDGHTYVGVDSAASSARDGAGGFVPGEGVDGFAPESSDLSYITVQDVQLLEHVRHMFEIAYGPLLAVFSISFENAGNTPSVLQSHGHGPQTSQDENWVINSCLTGLNQVIHCACVLGLDSERDVLLATLYKFTGVEGSIIQLPLLPPVPPHTGGKNPRQLPAPPSLFSAGNLRELKQKNVAAIRAMLNCAFNEGDHLGSAWGYVLSLVSVLDRLLVISSDAATDDTFFNYGFPQSYDIPQVGQGPIITPQMVQFYFANIERRDAERIARGWDRDLIVQSHNAHSVSQAITEGDLTRLFVASVKFSDKAIVDFVVQLAAVSLQELLPCVYPPKEFPSVGSQPPESLFKPTNHHSRYHAGTHAESSFVRDRYTVASDPSRKHPTNTIRISRIFSLQKVVEVAEYNMNVRSRMVWNSMWEPLGKYFAAVCTANVSAVAMYAIDSLKQLALKFLTKPELPSFSFQNRFLAPFVYIMEATSSSVRGRLQNLTRKQTPDAIAALQNDPLPDIRELTVRICANIIQSDSVSATSTRRAPHIRSGWKSFFAVFESVSQDSEEDIVSEAFSTVHTILSDHWQSIVEAEAFPYAVRALTSFGKSSHLLYAFKAIDHCATLGALLARGKVPIDGDTDAPVVEKIADAAQEQKEIKDAEDAEAAEAAEAAESDAAAQGEKESLQDRRAKKQRLSLTIQSTPAHAENPKLWYNLNGPENMDLGDIIFSTGDSPLSSRQVDDAISEIPASGDEAVSFSANKIVNNTAATPILGDTVVGGSLDASVLGSDASAGPVARLSVPLSSTASAGTSSEIVLPRADSIAPARKPVYTHTVPAPGAAAPNTSTPIAASPHLPSHTVLQSENASDFALLSVDDVKGGWIRRFTDSDAHLRLWWPLLTGLASLITQDPRLPVRLRSLHALFALLRRYGAGFSLSLWTLIYQGVLLPIFDDVMSLEQEQELIEAASFDDSDDEDAPVILADDADIEPEVKSGAVDVILEETDASTTVKPQLQASASGSSGKVCPVRRLKRKYNRFYQTLQGSDSTTRMVRPLSLSASSDAQQQQQNRARAASQRAAATQPSPPARNYALKEFTTSAAPVPVPPTSAHSLLSTLPTSHPEFAQLSAQFEGRAAAAGAAGANASFDAVSKGPSRLEWLRTTAMSTLASFVRLHARYYPRLRTLLPSILRLLRSYILSKGEDLSRLGCECYKILLSNVHEYLEEDDWRQFLEALKQAAAGSLPLALIDSKGPLLGQWGEELPWNEWMDVEVEVEDTIEYEEEEQRWVTPDLASLPVPVAPATNTVGGRVRTALGVGTIRSLYTRDFSSESGENTESGSSENTEANAPRGGKKKRGKKGTTAVEIAPSTSPASVSYGAVELPWGVLHTPVENWERLAPIVPAPEPVLETYMVKKTKKVIRKEIQRQLAPQPTYLYIPAPLQEPLRPPFHSHSVITSCVVHLELLSIVKYVGQLASGADEKLKTLIYPYILSILVTSSALARDFNKNLELRAVLLECGFLRTSNTTPIPSLLRQELISTKALLSVLKSINTQPSFYLNEEAIQQLLYLPISDAHLWKTTELANIVSKLVSSSQPDAVLTSTHTGEENCSNTGKGKKSKAKIIADAPSRDASEASKATGVDSRALAQELLRAHTDLLLSRMNQLYAHMHRSLANTVPPYLLQALNIDSELATVDATDADGESTDAAAASVAASNSGSSASTRTDAPETKTKPMDKELLESINDLKEQVFHSPRGSMELTREKSVLLPLVHSLIANIITALQNVDSGSDNEQRLFQWTIPVLNKCLTDGDATVRQMIVTYLSERVWPRLVQTQATA